MGNSVVCKYCNSDVEFYIHKYQEFLESLLDENNRK